MILVSDKMIRRASAFVGRDLTADECEEFRRMSELIARDEDDVAWTIVLAMWGGRAGTTSSLKDARDGVEAGLETWMERVRSDIKAIDENRRSMTREVAEEAGKNSASITMAAREGTAVLAKQLAGLESQVAAMAGTVERAMAGASGALVAAKKRDLDVQAQVKALADDYARKLSDSIETRAISALNRAERRLALAAAQAELAAKPLVFLASLALAFMVLGAISTAIVFLYLVPRK